MSSHDATAARLLVRRGDLAQVQLKRPYRDAKLPLSPGQARLRVERFAPTANNITYAALGESMRYWQFFPAPGGCSCIPVRGLPWLRSLAPRALRPASGCTAICRWPRTW